MRTAKAVTSDQSQQLAVAAGLATDYPVVCVQGPPGTGKTRIITEVVAKTVASGKRVLAAATSNTAVDNMVEKFTAAKLRVVRIGNPARIETVAHKYSLSAQVEQLTGQKLEDLGALRQQLKSEMRSMPQDAEAYQRALRALGRLSKAMRRTVQKAEEQVLRNAQVVLATCAGAGEAAVASCPDFDLVVIDEAAQATEPATWIPALRGHRVMMVGDACQLAPLVKSVEARKGGLAVSLLERLQGFGARCPPPVNAGVVAAMLQTQYRMHAKIAAWASVESYGGKLGNARYVANRTLSELKGVAVLPLTQQPLLLLDTRRARARVGVHASFCCSLAQLRAIHLQPRQSACRSTRVRRSSSIHPSPTRHFPPAGTRVATSSPPALSWTAPEAASRTRASAPRFSHTCPRCSSPACARRASPCRRRTARRWSSSARGWRRCPARRTSRWPQWTLSRGVRRTRW